MERIGRYLKGKDAIDCFDRLFRGDGETLFRIAPARDLEAWFTDELRSYQSPHALGVTRLAMHWLNADRDLATLCRIACLSESGPRFDPRAFAETLAATWITVPPDVRSALAPFDRPAGAPDSVYTQMGMALMDMGGFQGRRIRRHIPRDAVIAVLTDIFPEQAAPIRDAIDEQAGSIMLPEQLPGSASWTHAEFVRMFERACDAHGINLTEDAWAWIDVEQDRDLLAMLIAFAAMNEREQRFWNMRLALCECRAFAQAVLAASRDPTIIDEVAASVRDSEDEQSSADRDPNR